jgi:hypothetical protein
MLARVHLNIARRPGEEAQSGVPIGLMNIRNGSHRAGTKRRSLTRAGADRASGCKRRSSTQYVGQTDLDMSGAERIAEDVGGVLPNVNNVNLNPAVRPNGVDHQWRKEPPM